MKKQLLALTTLLLVVILSMSSCMVSYHPAFAPGHYNHHPENAPHHMEHHEHGNPHHDEALSKPAFIEKNNVEETNATDEMVSASMDEQVTPIVTEVIPVLHSTSPVTNKKIEAKQIIKSNEEIISNEKTEVIIPNENASIPKAKKENSNSTVTHDHESNQLLCAVVAFFIPPLGVILYEGAITTNFWIDLILTLLFWLPGFIFALIVILG